MGRNQLIDFGLAYSDSGLGFDELLGNSNMLAAKLGLSQQQVLEETVEEPKAETSPEVLIQLVSLIHKLSVLSGH